MTQEVVRGPMRESGDPEIGRIGDSIFDLVALGRADQMISRPFHPYHMMNKINIV